MTETRGQELCEGFANDQYNPLYQRGLLELVLAWVGPGEHAFIAAVSKSFRAYYLTGSAVEEVYITFNGSNLTVLIDPHTTTCRAVFGSPSRLQLAMS
jgi:hypothetical protein